MFLEVINPLKTFPGKQLVPPHLRPRGLAKYILRRLDQQVTHLLPQVDRVMGVTFIA